MATTVKEMVQVKALTKYGFQNNTGEYINWSKNIKDADKGRVIPGGSFEMELYVADSGKKYVNSVLAGTVAAKPSVVVPIVEAPKETPKAVVKAPVTETMSRSDWDAKDRRISRQGIIQVAVQVESKWEKAVELANKMLEFVNG